MVMAVIITAVVFTLGAVWVSFAEHATNSSRYARHREQAVDAAHAGLAVAAAALSRNGAYTGTGASPVLFPGGSAQYSMSVTTPVPGPGDPARPFRRVITSTGYAPSPDAPGRARRTLRQEVDLDPVAFQYAMLSENGISTGSSSAVVGDIYANGAVSLGNSQDYLGNIYVRGSLTTGSNQTITGDIHASANCPVTPSSSCNGSVTVGSTSTRVKGSVFAAGSITTGGTIEDDAVAGGAIGCGKVLGTCSPNTSPPAVPEQHLPAFTWNKANYNPVGIEHASGTALVDDVLDGAASGAHWAGGDVDFPDNGTITLAGDLTIVATGHIELPRKIVNGTTSTVQLTIISTGGGYISPANNFTIPSTVLTLMYTTGQFVSSNSSTFTGALYAGSLSNGAHLKVTHAALKDTGFDWSSANPQSFDIRNVSTREVAT